MYEEQSKVKLKRQNQVQRQGRTLSADWLECLKETRHSSEFGLTSSNSGFFAKKTTPFKIDTKGNEMTTQTEVQGIVQALFGAYAGAYLAELTAEAEANGSAALATRLATIQGVILGRDLSDDQDFVDTILWNLGVQSTNNAYDAASAWAIDALDAGASRSDIVYAAVLFLEAVADGTIVDSNYTDIADAFVTSVAAGIEYSETDAGAAVYSLADLQDEAGIDSSVFNLVNALTDYAAAQEVEAAALAAAADVAAANFAALGYSAFDADADDELSATELATFTAAYDAVEVAADQETADEAVTDAETALAAARGDTIDVATAGFAGAFADYDGLAASDARLADLLAAAQALVDDSTDVATAQTAIDDAETAVADDVDTNGTNTELLETLQAAIIAFGDATQLYVSTGTETLADVLAEILIALDTGTDAAIEDAVTTIAGYGTADTADTDIDDVGALIEGRADLIADVTTAETAYAAVDEVADLAIAAELVSDRDDLIADVTAAEELADAVTAVVDAYDVAATATDDAETTITDAGWAVQTLDTGLTATTDSDVFLATDLTEGDIADFGDAGTDLIYFGTGYSLVTMVAEDETADDIDGDVSAVEIFVVDDGTDLFLYVEVNAFDGSTDSNGDIVTIELTGMTGSTVSLTASGYLSIA